MEAYYKKIKAFCSWLDAIGEINSGNVELLIAKLMDIYLEAARLTLPNVDDCDNEAVEEQPACVTPAFSFVGVAEKSLAGLHLSEIYDNLRRAILLYESGNYSETSWDCVFDFRSHWYHHALCLFGCLGEWMLDSGYGPLADLPCGKRPQGDQ